MIDEISPALALAKREQEAARVQERLAQCPQWMQVLQAQILPLREGCSFLAAEKQAEHPYQECKACRARQYYLWPIKWSGSKRKHRCLDMIDP